MAYSRLAAAIGLGTALLGIGSALAQPTAPKEAKKPEGVKATLPQAKAAPNLIPRNALFGNPDKLSPRLSPDGAYIAYIAPLNGVLNVWVGPAAKPDEAKPVTNDTKRGIRQFNWLYNNTHLMYSQDVGGDESWKIFAVDVKSGQARDLTPFDSIPGPDGTPMKAPNSERLMRPAAFPQEVSPKFPDEMLISINNRNPQYRDVLRVNVKTGESKQVLANDTYSGIVTDEGFNVRFATLSTPDGGTDILKADGKGGFAPFSKVGFEDALTTNPVTFDKDYKTLYMIDSRGRDTAAVVAVDAETGKATLIADDKRADAGGLVIHPTNKNIQAVLFDFDRVQWKVIDPAIQPDIDYLRTVSKGDLAIEDRTQDDKHWVVSFREDIGGTKYYTYDRTSSAPKATFLFAARKALAGLTLAPMHPVVIKSRDGLNLVSYLTLPSGTESAAGARPAQPLPMILDVHGGPWARDMWGYNGEVQWLANRGYAVLQVNYRGSTGFGKAFVNAADREWGGKMHDDLIDAVHWAVKEKIADPSRVAIYGGSYGGYAALAGMTMTPEVFACGVDIVGVANLNTFMKTIPPYWAPFLEQMKRRVGDFTTEDGRKFLASRSPVTFTDKIKRPLIIAQGLNDPRVNHDESEQVVKGMQAKNIPVTYVLYTDEGHGFARPENRMSFYAVSEAFLAEHLGGKYEPIGDDFKNSSITVPTGAEHVPGLADSLHK